MEIARCLTGAGRMRPVVARELMGAAFGEPADAIRFAPRLDTEIDAPATLRAPQPSCEPRIVASVLRAAPGAFQKEPLRYFPRSGIDERFVFAGGDDCGADTANRIPGFTDLDLANV